MIAKGRGLEEGWSGRLGLAEISPYIKKLICNNNILLYSIENFYFVLCNDLYLALCDAMDPSGSSVHGTFQARILE